MRTNVEWDGQKVSIKGQKESLLLSWAGSTIQVGDFTYSIDSDILDIDALIQSPTHWLGNYGLTDFTGPMIFRLKEQEIYNSIKIHDPKIGTTFSPVKPDSKNDILLYNLHLAVRQYLADDPTIFSQSKKYC